MSESQNDFVFIFSLKYKFEKHILWLQIVDVVIVYKYTTSQIVESQFTPL